MMCGISRQSECKQGEAGDEYAELIRRQLAYWTAGVISLASIVTDTRSLALALKQAPCESERREAACAGRAERQETSSEKEGFAARARCLT